MITDALAVGSLASALIILALDITFIFMQTRLKERFIDQQNKRLDDFIERQDVSQDAVHIQQAATFSKMMEVLAEISERAKIVQE